MLFIVHPNYEQERLDAVIASVQKEIADNGGIILKTDNWGKRKLAYLINKQRYGSYVLMYFEADPQLIQGLYEWMEIQAQVLHQLVIRLEEKPELSNESENPDSPSSGRYTKAVAEKENPAESADNLEEDDEIVDEDEETSEEEGE
jgi:small subunit ribosomal protein S6